MTRQAPVGRSKRDCASRDCGAGGRIVRSSVFQAWIGWRRFLKHGLTGAFHYPPPSGDGSPFRRQARDIHVSVIPAILPGELNQEIVLSRRGTNAELHGVNACAVAAIGVAYFF